MLDFLGRLLRWLGRPLAGLDRLWRAFRSWLNDRGIQGALIQGGATILAVFLAVGLGMVAARWNSSNASSSTTTAPEATTSSTTTTTLPPTTEPATTTTITTTTEPVDRVERLWVRENTRAEALGGAVAIAVHSQELSTQDSYVVFGSIRVIATGESVALRGAPPGYTVTLGKRPRYRVTILCTSTGCYPSIGSSLGAEFEVRRL
jgi:hypothetical protein